MTTPRDRVSTAQGRIIIAGTGRAGTTFLVQLFSALRFDTGFTLEESLRKIDKVADAGLETPLIAEGNPYVIKSPWYAKRLAQALQQKKIEIYAAIIPVRSLFDAAESRRRVYQEHSSRGRNPLLQLGGLWGTDKILEQEQALAEQFYKTIVPLIEHEIPTYLIGFPRMVRQPDYLFRKLQPLMENHGVSRSEFLEAHGKTARPELVHNFRKPKKNKEPSV